MNEHYNFQTVLGQVELRIDDIVSHLFPAAKKRNGCWRLGNINGEEGDSLSIQTTPGSAGVFKDHADPEIRGNAIALWALAKGVSYQQAGNELAKFLGVRPDSPVIWKKKEVKPAVRRNDAGRAVFMSGKQEWVVQDLTNKAIQYAESRGISPDTLRAYRCGAIDNHIIFPHFDSENNPVLLKAWSCDDRKNMFSNNSPVHTLFGKHLVDPIKNDSAIVITEGQWDAMSWYEAGIPAVSIPSGVSNEDWVSEDWAFLNCFQNIFLNFDDDEQGRGAEQSARIRLGYERCHSVRFRFKDANEALKAGAKHVLLEALEAAKAAPIEALINPDEAWEKTRDRLNRADRLLGSPFFLRQLNFQFCPHEVTLWLGNIGHGKTSILFNQICSDAARGSMSMVASFEQSSAMSIANMLVQFTADNDIGGKTWCREAYDALMDRVKFFDSMRKANPRDLITTMTLAYQKLGVRTFVIDNIMTLDVDRQDNTRQAEVADIFRVFVATYPVHLHLVAHPRKPSAQDANKPPNTADIMGAQEWGAMAQNIICVWRDIAKANKISEMLDQKVDMNMIRSFMESCPDGKVLFRKQRDTGDLPIIGYRYDPRIKRAWKVESDKLPYFRPSPAGSAEDQ